MADGKNRKIKLNTVYAVFLVGVFGILFIMMNIYQLYHLPWNNHEFGNGGRLSGKRIAWIYSKDTYHLNHVMAVFDRMGFVLVHSMIPPSRWDVMWSFDFPFSKELTPMLQQLNQHQHVNHLPGLGFLTLKVELATSKLKWIPKAFEMPKDKQALLAEAKSNPKSLWVQKSNDHRGIKIVNVDGLNLSAEKTFVQLFIQNPLLIDGKKFDIGVYTTVTSVDPLRVYIYEEEMLIRFCQTNYEPLNVNDVSSYVVGEDYYAPSQLPSLQSYFNHGHYSRKQSLFGYLENRGKNTKKLWKDIRQAIREAFIAKEKEIAANFAGYKSQYNFFELVRFDFVIDEDMNIWLMEVNMSPNLSSAAHAENKLMYEQIVYNTFKLTGISQLQHKIHGDDASKMIVNDRDVMVNNRECRQISCLSGCQLECSLCLQCLSDDMKMHLTSAFSEHSNRGNYRRILPIPKVEKENLDANALMPTGINNALLEKWFMSKCNLDSSWCQ